MMLSDCLCFKGEIITPNDSSYEEDRQEWNRAIQKYPVAIFYCVCKEDVISAVKFCTMRNYKFRIRCGGHNYEGFSTGDRVIVIDVSRLKKIDIDYEKNTVKIEAGVKNRELYEFLAEKGYPFPGGTCPTVGVVGYTLGGGWGLSSRLFGLGLDNLTQAEIVDYRGKALIANRDCNSDLFWALRGAGGGNFGVVTSLIFNLPPKFNKVTLFTIYYAGLGAEEQAIIMNEFQLIMKTLDRRMNIRASFYNSKEEGVAAYLSGLFYGTSKEAEEILQPLLQLPKAQGSFQYLSFIDAIRQVMASYPDSEMFKSTGCFATRIYTIEELLQLTKGLQKVAEGSVFAAVTFYGLGGAVKDTRKEETAFYYRNADYIMGIQSVWEEPEYEDINKRWVASRLRYMKTLTEGFYINFPYSPLSCYGREYYGGNYCSLLNVNKKYDPFNVFKFPQSI